MKVRKTLHAVADPARCTTAQQVKVRIQTSIKIVDYEIVIFVAICKTRLKMLFSASPRVLQQPMQNFSCLTYQLTLLQNL